MPHQECRSSPETECTQYHATPPLAAAAAAALSITSTHINKKVLFCQNMMRHTNAKQKMCTCDPLAATCFSRAVLIEYNLVVK